jgi:neutral ceramidase
VNAFRAGAARVDITPSIPTPLAGYPPIGIWQGGPTDHVGYTGRTGPFDGVHDPVFARALAVDDGSATAVLVALDVCVVERPFTERVRAVAAQRWQLPPEAIVLAASHNHSGPDYSGTWEVTPPTVEDFVLDRVVEAIDEALRQRRPARLGHVHTDLAGLTANRRDPSHPVDPRVPVLRIDAEDGTALAVLYSFACHPVTAGSANRLVSGEYPGVASAVVENALGGVALFLNGCAGNINPRAFPYSCGRNVVEVSRALSAARSPLDVRTLAEARRFGTVLGGTVLRAAAQTETSSGGEVRFSRREVDAPIKAPSDLEDYLRHVAHTPEAADELRRRDSVRTEVGALRIGPMTLLTLPGEPFVEIGLELERRAEKEGAEPGSVRAIGYVNDYPGYVLPPDQYRENRYENVATALSVDGAAAIIDSAAEMWSLVHGG